MSGPVEYPPRVEAMLRDASATAPLAEFEAAMQDDDNLWWRVGCGHHLNLYEQAMEVIEELNGYVADLQERLAEARFGE